MRLLLDTNRYRDLTDGDEAVVATLEAAEEIFVPFVVLAELRGGFAIGKRGAQNERALLTFLSKPGVFALYPDEDTTRSFAAVFRQLRAQGTPVPTHDVWIAALAMQHHLALYTRDRHFQHLPQLNLVQ